MQFNLSMTLLNKFIRRSYSLKEKPRLIMKTKPSIQEPVRADINWSRRLQRLLSVSPFNLLGIRVALTYLSGSNLLSGALWVATLEGVERLCYIAVISDPRRLFELKCYLIYSFILRYSFLIIVVTDAYKPCWC